MATYYVRADGTAANKAAATGPGSVQSACMNRGVHNGETFAAGDIIIVSGLGGSITAGALVPPSDGTSVGWITYRGEDSPVLDGGDSNNTCITISGRSYILMTGLDVIDALYYGVKIDNLSANIRIEWINASGCGNSGVAVYDESGDVQTDVLIEHCYCDDNVEAGIVVLEENDRITIRRNECAYNATAASGANSGGIRVKAEDGARGDDIVVEDNFAHNNGVGVTTGRGFGIYLDTLGTGCIARRNRCTDNYTDGMILEWTDAGQVHYNVFDGNGRHGFSLWRRSNSNEIYNNVSYGNNQNTWGGGFSLNGPGEGPTYTMSSNLVRNNISDGHGSSFEVDFNGGMQNDGTDGDNNVYSNNCWGLEAGNFIYWGGSGYATYDAWETQYGGTTYSIEADPLFRSPATGDFHLQRSSPCIDAGVDVGLASDKDGVIVPQTGAVDVGAYELHLGRHGSLRHRGISHRGH